ncbi:MAG: ParA family protein [Burkholderiales bacterium]|nr:ParA family protein [Burkholderiales bacterium]
MSRVIGLVQAKGGVGRSTVATTLAGELARASSVALVDCDMPQGTALAWGNIRRRIGRAERLAVDTARGQAELEEKVGRYRRTADYVVLDGPPHVGEMTRAILALADLCLVPIGASAAELWATANLLLLVEEARSARQFDLRIVWTRFRGHTRDARDLSAMVSAALTYRSLEATLGYRGAYASALGQGLTAAELPDTQARREVAALVDEVKRIVGATGEHPAPDPQPRG